MYDPLNLYEKLITMDVLIYFMLNFHRYLYYLFPKYTYE